MPPKRASSPTRPQGQTQSSPPQLSASTNPSMAALQTLAARGVPIFVGDREISPALRDYTAQQRQQQQSRGQQSQDQRGQGQQRPDRHRTNPVAPPSPERQRQERQHLHLQPEGQDIWDILWHLRQLDTNNSSSSANPTLRRAAAPAPPAPQSTEDRPQYLDPCNTQASGSSGSGRGSWRQGDGPNPQRVDLKNWRKN
jgi:hypothetical protein